MKDIYFYTIPHIAGYAGATWEPIDKTLRYYFNGTQRRSLFRYQSEELKILNITFHRVVVGLIIYRVYRSTLVPLRHGWLRNKYF